MIERITDRETPYDNEHVHEFYLKPPFCNPEHSVATANSIIFNFDPSRYAHSSILRKQALGLYETEKQRFFFSQLKREEDDKQIDLRDKAAVWGMSHHVLVHSGAGLMRWGTSDTFSIPYWDREAFQQAARLQEDPEWAERHIEISDALNINMLRTFTVFLGDRTRELTEDMTALEAALDRGQETRVSITNKQKTEFTVVAHEPQVFRDVYVAKLKHLLWLVDQQANPKIRHSLMEELACAIDTALDIGIEEGDLTVDMGIDTGISQDTYRPAYVISGFKQLNHLKSPTHSLPQQDCHRIELRTMLDSISRPAVSKPCYEDGRYNLPWDLTLDKDSHDS